MLLLVPSQKPSEAEQPPLGKQQQKHHTFGARSSRQILLVLPPQMDLSSTVIVSDTVITSIPNTTFPNGGNDHCQHDIHSVRQATVAGMATSSSSSSSWPDLSNSTTTRPSHQHQYRPLLHQPQHHHLPFQKDASQLWSQHLAFLEGFNAKSRGPSNGGCQDTTGGAFANRYPYQGSLASNHNNSNHGSFHQAQMYRRHDYSSNSSNTMHNTPSTHRRASVHMSSVKGLARASSTSSAASSCSSSSASSSSCSSSSSPSSTLSPRLRQSMSRSSRSGSPYPITESSRMFREAFKKAMTVRSPILTSTSSGFMLDLTRGPELESCLRKATRSSGDNRWRDQSGPGGDKLKSGNMDDRDKYTHDNHDSDISSARLQAVSQPDPDSLLPSSSTLPASASSLSSSLSLPMLRHAWSQPDNDPEQVMTAHDISLMTASLGALTPLEIQRRIYSQQHLHVRRYSSTTSSSSLFATPTLSRRGRQVSGADDSSARKSSAITSITNPIATMTSDTVEAIPPVGTQSHARAAGMYPLDRPLPHYQHQHQHQHQHLQHRIPPLGPSTAGLGLCQGRGISMGGTSTVTTSASGVVERTLPSWYYLPPSAFRIAADVGSETETEQSKREATQEPEQDETDEYLVFSSPMLDQEVN